MEREYLNLLGGAIFAITVAVSAGISSHEFLGYSLSMVLWTPHELITVDLSSAVSIGIMGAAAVIGAPSWSSMSAEDRLAVVLTVGLIGAGLVEPGYFANNELLGLAAVGVSAAGFWSTLNN